MENKCESCGARIAFDPKSGMLKCDHCESKFSIKTSLQGNRKREYTGEFSSSGENQDKFGYRCGICGAQISVGSGEEIKRCPSCGNVSLTPCGDYSTAPDAIIPFSITRKQAAGIFKEWIAKRKFAPHDLKVMARLEKISGYYTPVYNFSYDTYCDYYGVAVKTEKDFDGEERSHSYIINDTLHRRIDNILYSASKNVTDDFLSNFGAYPLDDMKTFSPEFLFGYTATDASRDITKAYKQIVRDEKKINERLVYNRISSKYDTIDSLDCKTLLKNVKFNYLYVPVWANHYTYKGKIYHCFINGATGAVCGKSPKSIGKVLAITFGVLAAAATIVLLLI